MLESSHIERYFALSYDNRNTVFKGLSISEMIFEENSLMAFTNGQKRMLESKAIGRRSPYPLGKHLWKVLNDSSLCPDDNVNEKLLKMMLRWIFHRDDNGDCIPMEERCDQARDGRDGLVSNTCLEKQLQETTNKSDNS